MRSMDASRYERILSFINTYVEEHWETPSIRIIAYGTGVPRQTVLRYLLAMDAQGDITYREGRITTPMSEKYECETSSVALLGEVACGLPTYAEENVEAYLRLPSYLTGGGNCFLLRAKGDSMIDIGVEEGDLVLIRQQSYASRGDIAVVLVGDEATLKRYYPEPEKKRVRLHPENSRMRDIYVENAIVQGVAIRVIKSLH